MAEKAMEVYLNDHLAGAMLGSDLAEQIRDRSEGTPFGDVMVSISAQIDEDRDTLIDLMERMGITRNPVKQATTWIAEKASRPKFSGLTSGDPDVGYFMALEAMTLGVTGKLSLWNALTHVADGHPELAATNLDELIDRAGSQRDALEGQRLAAAERALG
jgi:hypothetical protein